MVAEKSSSLSHKIEILDINDKVPVAGTDENIQSETGESNQAVIVPHERMVIDDVIRIWKEDPSTESLGIPKLHALLKSRNSSWQLSEKRVKNLLKQHGLLANQPQFAYASEIKSEHTPELIIPPLIRTQSAKKSGKGLYAIKKIPKDTLLWEENQFIFIQPIDILSLIGLGKACSYCGKPLQARSTSNGVSILSGLDCNVCNQMWCSVSCKKLDSQLHPLLKHSLYTGDINKKTTKKIIDSKKWSIYEKFCVENQWQAAYAVGLIFAHELLDKTCLIKKQFNAMAKIRQDIRYKALDSSAGSFDNSNGGALFVQEQQEKLWQEGYQKFSDCFLKDHLTYEEFMEYLGTYNINNINNSLFLIQSHLNHNCDPNVVVKFGAKRTDGIKVYAKRDINSNEELTTTYVSPQHTVQTRKRELRVNWGFICNCQKCKEDEKLQQRRKSSVGAQQQQQQQNNSKKAIKDMLLNGENQEFELEIPNSSNINDNGNMSFGERRKSVRFDDKVIALTE
ncbi:hypothetical protein PACTADRAFT_48199 [Pachysolen tannophilus NRRL Y-2460]|uniref:Histone-lysine N-methyltransferase SET5 n=1 Tax=Pachysolen tannophilus NRRL Y-2460 TaxID=669874 RepID=A0A1E4U346_PACTA|nr:hypothetical protein PACTADRAFT_48199 [Pachysolen tannophilus NRRL Y-2460]